MNGIAEMKMVEDFKCNDHLCVDIFRGVFALFYVMDYMSYNSLFFF